MQKTLHSSTIKTALAELGWSQKELAEQVGVTAQAVTNWLKGSDFPRPDKLLKLAMLLKLSFAELVAPEANAPVVAFRKKAGAKTTDAHRLKAMAMGTMLKPLVEYLPKLRALRTKINNPSLEYRSLQNAVKAVREKLGIGMQAPLRYQHIIGEFAANDAILVPVLWGQKLRHENALHILLPEEQVTFIFLNLDTHIEDFKFWMSHELAHVYTPELAGTDAGEDFADAFSAAFLFPEDVASIAYSDAIKKQTQHSELGVLQRYAAEHSISIFTVYCEIEKYAVAKGLPKLRTQEQQLHAVRTVTRGELVSEILFKPLPPEPSALIASAHSVFQSQFFDAMRRMLREKGTGPGYLQQVLDVSIHDGAALHSELLH
ncbi:helix-turn-helix domain-containing protein [Pseudoduganella sp. FT55W]|uniref:Helix-turn-helix domain-containing protein n=1 Tax=Duganella rivi TaxID=2666083 RepID=A0A7X4GT73_9BURK|nr:helix-turn-helix transcriptional regulator [Duganella rivi]MYM69240.1 helix-turn-helix domain-containing protein [Duganella rivi]